MSAVAFLQPRAVKRKFDSVLSDDPPSLHPPQKKLIVEESVSFFAVPISASHRLSLPLTPFVFIKNLPSHCLYYLMQQTSNHLTGVRPKISAIKTSCTATLFALSVIFSGLSKTQKMFKKIIVSGFFKASFNVLNRADFYTCRIENIFTGRHILESDHTLDLFPEIDSAETRKKLWKKQAPEYGKEFIRQIESNLNAYLQNISGNIEDAQIVKQIETLLTSTQFPFHHSVFLYLRAKLISNVQSLNSSTSFIYYIFLRRGDIQGFYHAFSIEQFYNGSTPNGSDLYRIYQSFITEFTLEEYFQKKGYGDQGENCLNHMQIDQFLKNFEKILANRNNQTEEEVAILSMLHKELFEITLHSLAEPPVSYNKEKRILSGQSFLFQVHQINPQDCVKNYKDFLEKIAQE